LLPEGVQVSLVGDCEFDHPLLIENLRFWGVRSQLKVNREIAAGGSQEIAAKVSQ
jgi:hypothetical protein